MSVITGLAIWGIAWALGYGDLGLRLGVIWICINVIFNVFWLSRKGLNK